MSQIFDELNLGHPLNANDKIWVAFCLANDGSLSADTQNVNYLVVTWYLQIENNWLKGR